MKRILPLWISVAVLLCWPAVPVVPAGNATTGFGITDVRLTFDNDRGERTVKRRQTALQAFVDIDYKGSGLFEGYWTVDGKFFADVTRYFTGGGAIRIASPVIPGLPTCCEGLHIVTLVIQKPVQVYKPVKGVYFVTTVEESIQPGIALKEPPDLLVVDPAGETFSWEGRVTLKTYLIEFIEDNPDRPIASAFTEENHYQMPMPVAKYRFHPGKIYFWRVKGFSATHEFVAESLPRRFRTIDGRAKSID